MPRDKSVFLQCGHVGLHKHRGNSLLNQINTSQISICKKKKDHELENKKNDSISARCNSYLCTYGPMI